MAMSNEEIRAEAKKALAMIADSIIKIQEIERKMEKEKDSFNLNIMEKIVKMRRETISICVENIGLAKGLMVRRGKSLRS